MGTLGEETPAIYHLMAEILFQYETIRRYGGDAMAAMPLICSKWINLHRDDIVLNDFGEHERYGRILGIDE